MARPILNTGRPRKKGERWPGGKLKKPDINPIAPASWANIRRDAVKVIQDPRLCSEIGRLSFFGELTVRQVGAAFRAQRIYREFEQALALKRGTPPRSYEIGIRGLSSNDNDSSYAEINYLDLQEYIPYSIRDIFEQLCVDDCHINSIWLSEIRSLLDYLARVFTQWDSRKKRTRKMKIENGISLYPRPERKLNTAKIMEIAASVKAKSISFNRPTFAQAIARYHPDLNEADNEQALAYFHAIKDRENYREEPSVRGGVKRFFTSETRST